MFMVFIYHIACLVDLGQNIVSESTAAGSLVSKEVNFFGQVVLHYIEI